MLCHSQIIASVTSYNQTEVQGISVGCWMKFHLALTELQNETRLLQSCRLVSGGAAVSEVYCVRCAAYTTTPGYAGPGYRCRDLLLQCMYYEMVNGQTLQHHQLRVSLNYFFSLLKSSFVISSSKLVIVKDQYNTWLMIYFKS